MFIDKLICVRIYALSKRIYQRTLQKRFHKTSLSLLNLRFQNLSSRIRHLGQVEKKVEGFAAR